MNPASSTVLYCHCRHAQVIPAAVKDAVLRGLCDSPLRFEAVPDLCELAAHGDPLLKRLAAAGPLKIAACHPRAVKGLFVAAGAPLPENACAVFNMRTQSADTILTGLGTEPVGDEDQLAAIRGLLDRGFAVGRAGNRQPISVPDMTEPEPIPRHASDPIDDSPDRINANRAHSADPAAPDWMPWFPVIDYDRCTHCMQCLSFCLFGVFGVDEARRIQVQHPAQCKTLCPACARVCPEAAILFPKHKSGSISGEDAGGDEPRREAMKVDISAILGGDIYATLRARGRFGKDRDAGQALEERRKCLAMLGELAADIPPEVLSSLPTPEEITRKAAEAVAKAKAALQTAVEQ